MKAKHNSTKSERKEYRTTLHVKTDIVSIQFIIYNCYLSFT